MIKNNLSILQLQDAVPEPPPSRQGDMAESGETYLETILVIQSRNESGIVRAVDIANELGFSKPSVSRALTLLKEKNLIKISQAGVITFTPEGRNYADEVFERHQLLTLLLKHIAKVPSDIAEKDACRIEHVISKQTMSGIRKFLESENLLSS